MGAVRTEDAADCDTSQRDTQAQWPRFCMTKTQQDQITTLNSTHSPLLRLPPELRNQIAALVLTNHHIHIRQLPRPQLARLPPGDHGFRHEVVNLEAPPPPAAPSSIQLHLGGGAQGGGGVSRLPALWRVCRQLYWEVGGLVFSGGNFHSFEDAEVMREFLGWAGEAQVEGIERLWISSVAQAEVVIGTGGKRLGGLRAVVVGSRVRMLQAMVDGGGRWGVMEQLRAGWELASERWRVEEMRGVLEGRVELVVKEL